MRVTGIDEFAAHKGNLIAKGSVVMLKVIERKEQRGEQRSTS